MAITTEVEVLCQQLKGKGMYPVPSTPSTTNSAKPGGSVHFQPIDPAQKSSVQAMDQSLLNSSLNLLDDSPQTQSSSNDGTTSHEQATPRIHAHGRNYPVLPTPYVNQTAVDQHQRAQPAPGQAWVRRTSRPQNRYNHPNCRTACNHSDYLS